MASPHPTLSIGSAGPFVRELQESLNLLPTKLARLVADGLFGPKTQGRVKEFQGQNGLTADGVVGPLTRESLLTLIAALGDVTQGYQNNLGRMAVVAVAKAEASLGGVFAKQSEGPDPDRPSKKLRKGHPRLLKYFRTSAPDPSRPSRSYFDEDAIRWLEKEGQLAPMPHWCGIFALWAVKTAGMAVGTWKMGSGISAVSGFRAIAPTTVAPGDVGYVNNGFEHHFVIEKVVEDQLGVKWASTIEGNGDPSSNFNFKSRRLSDFAAAYTCY